MDVGDPSNFIRIQEIYQNDFEALKNNLHSYSFTDAETRNAMLHLFNQCNYTADPHGAIGYLGIKEHLKNNTDTQCVFLETAHPVLDEYIADSIEIPEQIKAVIDKTKVATEISTYEELKSFLLS